jgi:hypothetical protein
VASLITRRLIGSGINYSQQPGAIENLVFVNKTGGLSNLSQTIATLPILRSKGHYQYEFGIKPEQTGIFAINRGI